MALGFIRQAYKEHGIPQIGVEGHTVLPAEASPGSAGGPPFFRFTVQPQGHILTFQPNTLAADRAPTQLQHAEIGAGIDLVKANQLFFPSADDGMARVLWEVEICVNPPAQVKPIKPKVWLLGNMEMKKEKAYLLK